MIRLKCKQDPYEWHPWFAWYPVEIRHWSTDDGQMCKLTAWWVWIEHRSVGSYAGPWWDYRLCKGQETDNAQA